MKPFRGAERPALAGEAGRFREDVTSGMSVKPGPTGETRRIAVVDIACGDDEAASVAETLTQRAGGPVGTAADAGRQRAPSCGGTVTLGQRNILKPLTRRDRRGILFHRQRTRTIFVRKSEMNRSQKDVTGWVDAVG